MQIEKTDFDVIKRVFDHASNIFYKVVNNDDGSTIMAVHDADNIGDDQVIQLKYDINGEYDKGNVISYRVVGAEVNSGPGTMMEVCQKDERGEDQVIRLWFDAEGNAV